MERSYRLAVLVGAIALALGALWYLSPGREHAVEPRGGGRDVVEHEPRPVLLPTVPRERVAVSAESPTAGAPAAPAPAPSRADEPAAARARIEVEVVEATLAPVPDITVFLDRQRQRRGQTTDALGRVAFEGVELEPMDVLHPVRVCAGVVAREPSWVTVDRPTPPGQPLRLILPPHGALDVEVRTPEGELVEDASVELTVAGEARVGSLSARMRPGMSAEVELGHARFPCVDLDLQLEVIAESMLGLGRAQALVDGPRSSGEVVRHTLVLGLDRTVLLFRALDEEGRGVTGELPANFVVRTAGTRSSRGTGVQADAEGRFEWTLDVAYGRGERRELEVRADGRGLSAHVDLSRSFPPGRIDMGDLVLRPLPLVASGRVVDPQGQPIEGVLVMAETRIDDGAGDRPVFFSSSLLSNRTGADGTFVLHGDLERGPVRLRLFERDLRVESREVPLGAMGVELVAHRTGGLAGRLLLDPGQRVGYPLTVSVHPDADPDAAESNPTRARRRQQEPPGTFEFDGLLPGSYTLTVRADEPLLEVPGITVASGEVARDPRIQEIDLRGRLHLFTLVLVSPPGSGEHDGSVTFTPAGASAPVRSVHLMGNEVELLTLLPRIDATVRASGCRPEHLTDLGPRTEVHLRAGLGVCLTLPAGIELPGPPLQLGATLAGEDDDLVGGSVQFFDERGELRCFVPTPGRYEVRWLLERRDTGGGGCGSIQVEPPQFVDVVEQEGEQRVPLQLTPEALDRALEVR